MEISGRGCSGCLPLDFHPSLDPCPHFTTTMTNLPSFIELMATLGIDNNANVSESRSPNFSHSRSSSTSSSASSPRPFSMSSTSRQAHKTQSIPSFRDLEPDRRYHRHRVARYSPYSFGYVSGYSITPTTSMA